MSCQAHNPEAEQAKFLAQADSLIKTMFSFLTADIEVGEKLLESDRAWMNSAKAYLESRKQSPEVTRA